MPSIKITIPEKSKYARYFKMYMKEKRYFCNAITAKDAINFVRQNGKKFDSPLSILP